MQSYKLCFLRLDAPTLIVFSREGKDTSIALSLSPVHTQLRACLDLEGGTATLELLVERVVKDLVLDPRLDGAGRGTSRVGARRPPHHVRVDLVVFVVQVLPDVGADLVGGRVHFGRRGCFGFLLAEGVPRGPQGGGRRRGVDLLGLDFPRVLGDLVPPGVGVGDVVVPPGVDKVVALVRQLVDREETVGGLDDARVGPVACGGRRAGSQVSLAVVELDLLEHDVLVVASTGQRGHVRFRQGLTQLELEAAAVGSGSDRVHFAGYQLVIVAVVVVQLGAELGLDLVVVFVLPAQEERFGDFALFAGLRRQVVSQVDQHALVGVDDFTVPVIRRAATSGSVVQRFADLVQLRRSHAGAVVQLFFAEFILEALPHPEALSQVDVLVAGDVGALFGQVLAVPADPVVVLGGRDVRLLVGRRRQVQPAPHRRIVLAHPARTRSEPLRTGRLNLAPRRRAVLVQDVLCGGAVVQRDRPTSAVRSRTAVIGTYTTRRGRSVDSVRVERQLSDDLWREQREKKKLA